MRPNAEQSNLARPRPRRTKALAIVGLAAGLVFSALASEPAWSSATYAPATKTFRLDGGNVTYAFGVTDAGALQSTYWGPRLAPTDTLPARAPRRVASIDPTPSVSPQEYPGWGGGLYTEPTLKIAYADGVRDVVLRYVSGRADAEGVTVELADIARPLTVTLRYTIDEQTGIVGRSATIRNAGRTPVRIDQASSAAWSLPVGDDYRLYSLTGRWAAEWTLESRPITGGSTVLESRRGSTSNQNNPWFAIDRVDISTEESGPVWFGALAWSGSWRISVDQHTRWARCAWSAASTPSTSPTVCSPARPWSRRCSTPAIPARAWAAPRA
jgi:alpha-galactosidase